MTDIEHTHRVNMKKPKHNSLALQCLAWAALALVSLPANAANSAAPDFTTIPSVTPATSNANSFVALNLTPEALSTDNPVVKINMARWFSGSTLIMQEPNGDLQQILFQNRADAAPYDQLMQDDATTEVPFKAGETRVIIDIGGQRTLQSFGFFSFSARGTLDIYYSNSSEMIKTVKTDPAEWKSANAHTDINTKQVVSLNLGAIDAHYIMIVFTMAEPGTISPLSMLGVISTTKDKKATVPNQASDDEEKKKNAKPVNPDDLVEFDYANAAYGTKVTHVLGGNTSEAQNVLGTNPKQSLILGSGTDQNAAATTAQTPAPAPATDTTSAAPVKVDNIFVVDMGKDHDINKVGLLFKTEGSGKFDFYLLKQLPTKTDNKTTGAIPAKTARLSRYQPILLAASEGSLAEALMLAQGAPAPDAAGGGGSGDIKPVDYLPADFFTNTKPTFTQEVAGNNNDNKITQNYDNNLQFRFALIRWVPTTPNQPPVEIFKVNLIGKVSIDNYVAASKSNVNLGPPASAPPSYAVVGPNPPPGQTADPGPGSNPAPTPTPTPTTKNPSPAPSQQIGDTGGGSGGNGGGTGGGGGGGGGSDPTEPPTPTAPSITP